MTTHTLSKRGKLLAEIYRKAVYLPRDSQEFKKIMNSGRLWMEYLNPFVITERDLQFQAENEHLIKDVEEYRRLNLVNVEFLRDIIPAYVLIKLWNLRPKILYVLTIRSA